MRRPVATVWVAIVVLTAVVCGGQGLVWALDCGGRLVSEGQTPWEVQTICGEPNPGGRHHRGRPEAGL